MDKATVRQIAWQLMAHHGLHRWTFELRPFKARLGQCETGRVPGTGVIALGEFYVRHNPEHLVLDTLLHEIAHALVGTRHGHGPIWKRKARELGCIPKACSKEARTPPGRYQATCPACKRTFHRHRKPKPEWYIHCPWCGREEGQLKFVEIEALPLFQGLIEELS
jgi:predicted SprT family Zn-dependent metalloprotease